MLLFSLTDQLLCCPKHQKTKTSIAKTAAATTKTATTKLSITL